MIRLGISLQLKAICPDCDKPMDILRSMSYSSIGAGVEGDFACVSCHTEGCISRYFVSTIEKKSGMVIFTDARYMPPRGDEQNWKPVYVKYVDADGKAIE